MSGFNGIYCRPKDRGLELRIKKMNKALAFTERSKVREEFINDHYAFGVVVSALREASHGGLSTIGYSQSGNLFILFSGEIYNRAELRGRLRQTRDSSEASNAVLSAQFIEHFGFDEFLECCDGAFGICVFDQEKSVISVGRDRLGIKPLYYQLTDEFVVFSTEIKGILHSGLYAPQLTSGAIDEYLSQRHVREPYTFFKNVYQVEAGTYLTIDRDLRSSRTRYWGFPKYFNFESSFDESALLVEFEEKIRESIASRIEDSCGLGAYLSGGVDSSLITAIAAQLHPSQLQTFSIGFPESNEFPYARIVADAYKTKHRDVLFSMEEYLASADDVITHKDAPLSVPNEVLLTLLTQELPPNLSTMLSGEGADELMGGYGRIFRLAFDYENMPNEKGSFYDAFVEHYEYVARDTRDRLIAGTSALRDEFDARNKSAFSARDNRENIFRFFHTYHAKGLINRVHSATMFAGVGARLPFLDSKLIAFAYEKIPYELKLKWISPEARAAAKTSSAATYSEQLDTPKYLLRALAYRYLPAGIVDRRKVGFPVPLDDWLKELELEALGLLTDVSWLHQKELNKFIKEVRMHPRAGQVLWMLMSFERFRAKYFDASWVF